MSNMYEVFGWRGYKVSPRPLLLSRERNSQSTQSFELMSQQFLARDLESLVLMVLVNRKDPNTRCRL